MEDKDKTSESSQKETPTERLKKLQKEYNSLKKEHLLLKQEVLDSRAMEEELKKALKKVANVEKTFSEEAVSQLSELNKFLFDCYKESDSVIVRTKIQNWRKLLQIITDSF